MRLGIAVGDKTLINKKASLSASAFALVFASSAYFHIGFPPSFFQASFTTLRRSFRLNVAVSQRLWELHQELFSAGHVSPAALEFSRDRTLFRGRCAYITFYITARRDLVA